MRTSPLLFAVAASLTAAACGSSSSPTDAHTTTDAPAGAIDAAIADAAIPDAMPDGMVVDASTIDAKTIDGAPDASLIDASPIDATPIDAMIVDGSPDGMPVTSTKVWIHGDFITNNRVQIGAFVDGATATLPLVPPVIIPNGTDQEVLSSGTPFAVSADGSKVAFAADLTVNTRYDLIVANADGSDPIVVVQNPGAVLFSAIAFSPDGTKLAYRADPVLATMYDAYVVPVAAGATPVKISPDRAANDKNLDASTPLAWSADSRYVAFGGDFTDDNYVELWAADTSVAPITTTTLISRASIAIADTGTKGFAGQPLFGPADTLFVRARISVDGIYRLYTVKGDGTGLAILPHTDVTAMSNAGAFGLSADGTTLAFAADGPTANAYEIYVMPSDGSAAATRITSGSALVGTEPQFSVPLQFNPAGTQVGFLADYTLDGKFAAYVAAVAGGDVRRLATSGVATEIAQDVTDLAWTGDGSALYIVCDTITKGEQELFRIDSTTVDQTPTLVVDAPMSGDVFTLATRY